MAAAGIKSGCKAAGPTKEVEMQGLHGADESLHHTAAQVRSHAVLMDLRIAGMAALHCKISVHITSRTL